MAVTFVKPRLDRMLQDRRDGTYYRVLAERDFGYVTYRCESVSALEWDLHWDFWYSIEDVEALSALAKGRCQCYAADFQLARRSRVA